MKKLRLFFIVLIIFAVFPSAISTVFAANDSTFWQWPVDNVKITDVAHYAGKYKECHAAGHLGYDMVGDTNVKAVANGKVATTGYTNDYGYYIVVSHNYNGITYFSKYQHLAKDSTAVKVGDTVTKGKKIAVMGNTGDSNGVHLHLEIGYKNNGNGVLRDLVSLERVLPLLDSSRYTPDDWKYIHSNEKAPSYYVEWGYVPTEPTSATIVEGEYLLRNGNVYLNASQDKDGGNVNAAAINNTSAQKWKISKSGNVYRLTSMNSSGKRVLNVYTDGTSASGTNVTLWAVTGHKTQLWMFEKKGDGYRIHPSDNLNVSLAVVSGNDVKLAANSDTSSQIWYIEIPALAAEPPTIEQPEIAPVTEPPTTEPPVAPPVTEPPATELPVSPTATNSGTVTVNSATGTFSAIMTNVGVKFDWTPSGSPFGYRIYRSTTAESEGISISDFPIIGNEYVDVNIAENTVYYYTIREVLADASFDPIAVEVTQEQLGESSDVLMIETKEIITSEGTKHFILMEIDKATMMVDEETVEIDQGRGTTPLLLNGRTLVPIRAIIETMDGTVGWDDIEGKITLNAYGHEVAMWVGRKDISVDSSAFEMDVSPDVINGRTMLPVRFVADNIGCQITWIGSSQQIVIVFYKNQ